MKKFLSKIIFYLVIIISFCVIMAGIQYINSTKKYLNKINITGHTTFLFSDSRGNHINTDSIGICNLSSPSENYIDIERKIEYLIDKKIEINHIILSYDEHLFSKYRDNANNNYKSIWLDQLSLSNINSILFKYRRNYVVDSYHQIILKIKTFNSKENKNNSFEKISKTERAALTKSRTNYQFNGFSKKQSKTFNSIIKLCKKNNIKIILIKFPVTESYLNEKINNKNYSNYKIPEIKNIHIIDFSNSIKKLKFYENQDHLNLIGKQQFIKQLAYELRTKQIIP